MTIFNYSPNICQLFFTDTPLFSFLSENTLSAHQYHDTRRITPSVETHYIRNKNGCSEKYF
ncbi:hypothetical protein CIJ69_05455 [Neisseria meningitidis]|nr:hypothetical protein A6J51_13260 [Neisseria meningitidis]OZS27247.1 hypothetical protein CG828_09160 [Neisseria meningitidis]PKT89980.1 hypothetical protein CWI61_11550 [Neisseria meningitidis]PKU11163.1 hypothetical protein CWI45_07785 [Neisseria meningitidis]QEN79903.1 hypothetical protein CCD82_10305 [Neisseria meningitidis]